MIASTMTQAYMQRRAAQAAEASAMFNAKLAEQRRDRALAIGESQETAHRMKVGQLTARQEAAAAGGGAIVGRGDPQSVMESTVHLGELDARTLQNNAASAARGHDIQASVFKSQALDARFMGSVMPGMTLLGGAASAAGMYKLGQGGGPADTGEDPLKPKKGNKPPK
jgi:hypothetical protein